MFVTDSVAIIWSLSVSLTVILIDRTYCISFCSAAGAACQDPDTAGAACQDPDTAGAACQDPDTAVVLSVRILILLLCCLSGS